MAKKKPLSDQVVVVTGGTSGVGRAVAVAAAGRGASVAVCARGEDGLEATRVQLAAIGAQMLVQSLDVADGEALDRFFSAVVERFGRVDSVVASAFTSIYAEFEQTEADELRRVLDVNFFGRANTLRAALPQLRISRGTYVDVSSGLAYRGIPLQSAYCASKAAGRALYESVRTELAHDGADVAISLVLPGAINTPHFDRVRQKTGMQPQPVPPIYEPEVIAKAVLHCCEHPERELPVSWGGQKVLWGQKVAPRFLDLFMAKTGYSGQTTGAAKEPDAGNLFEPLAGDPGAHGRFDEVSRRHSVWTALRLNRGKVAMFGALAAGALGASRRR